MSGHEEQPGQDLPPTHQSPGPFGGTPSAPPPGPGQQPYTPVYSPPPAQPDQWPPGVQGQPVYPAAQGYPQGYRQGASAVANHPRATTALVLGLVGLVGSWMCFFPAFAGPFAWWVGASARREIDSSPTPLGGRNSATAGMIMGIITTVWLVLSLIALGVVVYLAVRPSGWLDEGSSTY